VGKTGSAHAGKGKIKIGTSEMFEDYASLVALQPYFSTCERFVSWDWDGRVQKIGPHYRVFSRRTETWKGNSGRGAIIEEIELTPEYKLWADECSKIFGGVDILGLDFVHDKATDKFVILELNDTAIGLVHRCEQEVRRKLVLSPSC
jgi:glutathione synthase/RimK-type ligase-like ATP-grasp enzyme